MKNPNSARGAGAFRVTSNATVVRADDDTQGSYDASPKDARFYWNRRSNSIEPLALHMGSVWHE
ncbi:hypothetical protein [Cognatishimia sp. F0-27]|uniref:hypothetical protein n=1 Tax=Cognatishimia sp. F0-27 TaxID=2816855 RepID=UPI001D0C02E1|nr:hypothetical protein [Cognatishimia sp. F0-27]MCC1494063.1 hypothetical protein [Cognatishimia sp. F0-27]